MEQLLDQKYLQGIQNLQCSRRCACFEVLLGGMCAQIRDKLPALVEAVQQAGQVVTWVCDPMHGNTESCGSYKTRRFENVRGEVLPMKQPPLNACSCPLLFALPFLLR